MDQDDLENMFGSDRAQQMWKIGTQAVEIVRPEDPNYLSDIAMLGCGQKDMRNIDQAINIEWPEA